MKEFLERTETSSILVFKATLKLRRFPFVSKWSEKRESESLRTDLTHCRWCVLKFKVGEVKSGAMRNYGNVITT